MLSLSQTTSSKVNYSDENETNADEVKLKIGRLIVRLSVTYGHLWSSQFKSEEHLKIAKLEWAKTLGHYSYEKLDNAFERCKHRYKKAPSLPEFMSCLTVNPRETYSETNFKTPHYLSLPETEESIRKRKMAGKKEMKKILAKLNQ